MNGLSGTITDFNDTSITIKVDGDDNLHHNLTGRIFKLDRYNFIIRDEQNKVVANRQQFPLRLGYAMTVDKAQGCTLDAVVDCYNFWRCGQLGVVVGRTKNKAGLEIQNFNTFASTIPNPKVVQEFYQKCGAALKQSKECCQQKVNIPAVQALPCIFGPPQIPNMDPNSTNAQDDEEVHETFPHDTEDFITGELFEPVTPIEIRSCYQLQKLKNFNHSLVSVITI